MENAEHRPNNPYTAYEGYRVLDSSGEEVGTLQSTIYDAPSDVLKYILVDGHAVPAEMVRVNPKEERVTVPYDKETVQSAPRVEDPSGDIDKALREHYS